MDIRLECHGDALDNRTPRPAFFNYDGDPSRDILKTHLITYVTEDRDDFTDDECRRATATVTIDDVTSEGQATVHVDDEEFRLRLFINPDIARGASVRVSSPEAPNHGAYGVLYDADLDHDRWTVEILEGGHVHFTRDELADLSRRTTTGGADVSVPPQFEVGEYVLYRASHDEKDLVVRIASRRYLTAQSGAE